MTRGIQFVDADDFDDEDWPPPVEKVWSVTGTMGAAGVGTDSGGDTEPVVMMRFAASRPGGAFGVENFDETFVLDQLAVTHCVAGLLGMGALAWGRAEMIATMASVLGVDPGSYMFPTADPT